MSAARKPRFVVVCTVQGEATANVIKGHLESEGVMAILQYESVSRVYGLTADGLGAVKVLVPEELAEQAKQIIQPSATDPSCLLDSPDDSGS